jgi:hypothetical protein
MPISLAKVRDRVVVADVPLKSKALFGDEEPMLHVAYRPSVLTPLFESELAAYGTHSDGWAKLISRLVDSWDFQGEDGKPQSLEFEALRAVPGPFLAVTVAAIREHIAPSPKTDEESADGSSPEASSEASPTTTHSFERLDTPASPPGN